MYHAEHSPRRGRREKKRLAASGDRSGDARVQKQRHIVQQIQGNRIRQTCKRCGDKEEEWGIPPAKDILERMADRCDFGGVSEKGIVGGDRMPLEREPAGRPKGHEIDDERMALRVEIPDMQPAHDRQRDGKGDADTGCRSQDERSGA